MKRVQDVVVVGGDSVAWIAATAIARAFRHRGVTVRVVDTGPAADASLLRSTLPSQRALHSLLGILEPELMVRTGATYKLGVEHAGWQGGGSRFFHAYGEIGREIAGLPFYKWLARRVLSGRVDSASNYSLAALAAASGRFARPMGDDTALTSSFTYGFHLDEAAYTVFLRECGDKNGVARITGRVASVSRDDGGIAALTLMDGTRISADLWLDCTGAVATVIGPDPRRVDWSAWLPCDSILTARAPPSATMPPFTRTTAASAGWTRRAPLLHGTGIDYVYSSRFQDEAAARTELSAAESAPAAATLTHFTSGRRVSFWDRNCVAIGAAAIELEPLAGVDLHAAQVGVSTLIEMFPLDAENRAERFEYDRVMAEQGDALLDFTLAHYLAGAPRPGAFWESVRVTPPPPRLTRKLDLFRANGRIELLDFETFEETDWAWLLLGAGCWPEAIELTVALALDAGGARDLAPLAAQLEQLAASMPPHSEYLRRLPELAARRAR